MKVTSPFMCLLVAMGLVFPCDAHAVTRDQVIINAQSFATHVWSSTAANNTASCAPGYSSKFLEIYGIGGTHVGLPYKWGGFDTISSFNSEIAQGFGAGSHSSDGVLSCVTGLDCSGFVSRTWELASKKGTWTIHDVSHEISQAALLPGDALNKASTHIYLFHKLAGDGAPDVYEAAGGVARKVRYNTGLTWAKLQGYTPIRYDGISGDADAPQGADPTPIPVDSFPFHHDFSTWGQPAWGFNTYSCAPNTGEWGPEVVYEIQLDQPGELSAQVSDGVGVDIDLHILSDLDPNSCLDRDDVQVGPVGVGAGTTYLVADTWSNSSGVTYPGAYSLDIWFEPTAGPEPIVVDSFPYTHAHTTIGGVSKFNTYSCAPGTGEQGPEVVYELHLEASGTLSAQVSDGPGVDIDLHVLSSLNSSACVERDDTAVGPLAVNSGVIYLVADSWSNGSGSAYPGAYQLQIQFQADAPLDQDNDGVADTVDGCPTDGNKTIPGICGCGQTEADMDADGSPNCVDACPADAAKVAPGICGCGTLDSDADGDGALDCEDTCPQDGAKQQPGLCGCGVSEIDSDGDGLLDCQDLCPSDSAKMAPGTCGCGLPDGDLDADGVADCVDGCPQDAEKQGQGVCGCGVPDVDIDADGVMDCEPGSPQVWTPDSTVPDGNAIDGGVPVRFQATGPVRRPGEDEVSGCAAGAGRSTNGAPLVLWTVIVAVWLRRRAQMGSP